MLLRRVIEHVKAQNWTAVALDFVIVVVGVFIGIQVANWNEARAEKERIAAQLESFRSELIFARTEMEELRNYIEARIDGAKSLRERLADASLDISDEEIYALSFSAMRLSPLDVKFRAFDELSTTGAISKIDDLGLRERIYKWDTILADFRSSESDAAEFRNIVTLRPFFDSISFGNAARTDPRYEDMLLATRFAIDIEALRKNRDIDNALAMKVVLETQKLNGLRVLAQATDDLIAALEAK